ncbi:hypothetical protein TNCV_2359981 [Trichonephila clavipes]|nr:hypothetical protein TNCV_2359981 [Trichonephila clavipes]
MASLGHQSLPPINLGRVDEDMVSPGDYFEPNPEFTTVANREKPGKPGFRQGRIANRDCLILYECRKGTRNGIAYRREPI